MKKELNSPTYAFWGSYDFSAFVLEKLIKNNLLPALIICSPDKPAGRKKELTPSPVKKIALRFKIPFLQPENLSSFKIPQGEKFDFFLVVAYSKIIPKNLLYLPKLKTLAIHPSLLPKYRGPSPIQTAILNGDSEFGITLFLADEKIDHGKIIKKLKIKDQPRTTKDSGLPSTPSGTGQKPKITYKELEKILAELGADLVIKTLPGFLKGKITPLPQDESQATYTRKFKAGDGFVDFKKDSLLLIDRKIRALNPEPGVYTFLKINQIEPILGYKIKGKPEDKKRIKLLESDFIIGKLKLLKIQIEGKKPAKVDKMVMFNYS